MPTIPDSGSSVQSAGSLTGGLSRVKSADALAATGVPWPSTLWTPCSVPCGTTKVVVTEPVAATVRVLSDTGVGKHVYRFSWSVSLGSQPWSVTLTVSPSTPVVGFSARLDLTADRSFALTAGVAARRP